MNNKKIEIHIKNAIKAKTPDIFDQVSSVYVERIKEDNTMIKNSIFSYFLFNKMAGAIAICAVCIMAAFGVNYMNRNVVDTIIGIDVNPSIELKVNKSNEVIDVVALNEDALEIIDGMDLKNVDVNTTVNAIIGSMVKHGYISELKNEILVSVENNDEEKSEQIKESVVAGINNILAEKEIIGVIFSQPIKIDKELKETAEEANISVGKAAFLIKLIANNSNLTIEQLASMSLHEIIDLVKSYNLDLNSIVDYDDIKEIDKEEDKKAEEALKEAEEALKKAEEALKEAEESAKEAAKDLAEIKDEQARDEAENANEQAEEAIKRGDAKVTQKLEQAQKALDKGEEQAKKKAEQAKEAAEKGHTKQAEKKAEQAEKALEKAKQQAEKKLEQARDAAERAKQQVEQKKQQAQTEAERAQKQLEQANEVGAITGEQASREKERAVSKSYKKTWNDDEDEDDDQDEDDDEDNDDQGNGKNNNKGNNGNNKNKDNK